MYTVGYNYQFPYHIYLECDGKLIGVISRADLSTGLEFDQLLSLPKNKAQLERINALVALANGHLKLMRVLSWLPWRKS